MSDEDILWPEVAKAIIRMACIPDGIILPPGELDEWLDALAGHATSDGDGDASRFATAFG